jgi:hypothetical protein
MSSVRRIGRNAELRFLRVANERTEQTPPWFSSVKEAAPQMDAQGVDAIAFIKVVGRKKLLRVPIQVKSSRKGTRGFLRQQQRWEGPNFIVVVVHDLLEDDAIRRRLYGLLQNVRDRNITYEIVWRRLNKMKRYNCISGIAKEITENRKKYRVSNA